MTDLPPFEADHDDARVPLAPPASGEVVTVVADRLVAGGEALARHPDGRVVLVAGALPGEQVILLRRTGQHPLRPVRRTELAGPDPVRRTELAGPDPDAGRAHEPAPFEPLETEAPPFGSPFSIPPYSFTVLEFEETR